MLPCDELAKLARSSVDLDQVLEEIFRRSPRLPPVFIHGREGEVDAWPKSSDFLGCRG